MENLIFVFFIAIVAFWIGRFSKQFSSTSSDTFKDSPIQSSENMRDQGTERVAMNARRAFTLVFFIGWITAWSAGIYLAARAFLDTFGIGFETLFLGGWLLAAITGWFYAANTILKLITCKPVRARDGQIF